MTQIETNNHPNKTKKMSVQVGLFGLSFLLKEENTIVSKKEVLFNENKTPEAILFEVKQLLETNIEFKNKENQLEVIYINPYNTLVPKNLFSEKNAKDYLKFNTQIFNSDYISFDDLTELNLVNVYIPLVNINNYFFEYFGRFDYFHFSSVFIEKVLQSEESNQNTKIFAHLHQHQLDLLVIKDNNILLSNNFKITSEIDFAYYLLFSIQQLNFDANNVDLQLSGNISKNDAYYELIGTYIKNITLNNSLTTLLSPIAL